MTIELRANGLNVLGWKSASISTGLETFPRSFELETIDVNLPVAKPPGPVVPVRPTDPCEIWVRNQKVLTGYIDGIRVRSTPTGNGVNIRGRSKTQDIYDCSVDVGATWKEKRIEVIASEICEPFGVEVFAEVDTGLPVPRFSTQRAERAYDAIDRLCQPRGLLITDDERGRLVLTKAGATRSETAIEEGANVLEIEVDTDASQLHSIYWVRDQFAVAGDSPAQFVALQKQFVRDDTMDRYRQLEIIPSSRVSGQRAKDIATYEAAVRAGQSVDVTAKVSGWTKTLDGPIWRHNELVQVVSLTCGVFADLLVVSATYQLDLGGEIVDFQLAPQSGYELLAEPDRARTRGKRRATAGIGLWQELGDKGARGAVGGMKQERPASRDWWFEGKVDVRRK